jgi:hypothetical protein
MQSYQEAITDDRVPLPMLDRLSFYAGPFIGFIAGPVLFYRINLTDFEYDSTTQAIVMNFICISFIAFSIYAVIINRRQLRFSFIDCNKSDKEKENIILSVAKNNKWSLVKKETNYFKFNDTFSWTHWPYDITIIYDNRGFYINSLNRRFKPIDRGEGKEITNNIIDQIKSCL